MLNQSPTPGVETPCIFDQESDEYLLVEWGWDAKRRVRRMIVFLRIVSGKIQIEQDWTESGVALQLLGLGVDRNELVLAFHHPSVRESSPLAMSSV